MGLIACANLLHVSERTIRGWESGATRIPYAAYKLLRVLKGGRYLAHPAWKDWVVQGDWLHTPEGHRFQAGELGWWSLLVRQAREFQRMVRERRASENGAVATVEAAPERARPEAVDGREAAACETGSAVRPFVGAGGHSRLSIGPVDQNRGFSPVGPVELPPVDQSNLSAIGPRSNTGQKGVLVAGGAP
jgi:hypothetical protein